MTDTGSIYRSVNQGKTFEKLTEVFHRKAYIELDKDDKTGKVIEMIQSPMDKSIIIFKGSEGINWLSKDCGGEIEAMNQGRKVDDFKFHPTESTWLLATAFSRCDDYGKKPCSINREVYVTFDLGFNWKMIQSYVIDFSWAYVKESPEAIPKERIIITHNPYGKGKQVIKRNIANAHMSYSDNYFKTSKIMLDGVNSFTISFPYIYAHRLVDEASQKVSLHVTQANSSLYQFSQCEFPIANQNDIDYTILDTTHGQTFVLVNHWSSNSDFGSLYMSDGLGQKFSLSLKYVPKTDKDFFDFTKVSGMEGVYVANHYKEELFERGLSSSGDRVKEIYKQKVTKITFDRGGVWTTIPAPEKDSTGRKIPCEDETCTLNLNVAALTDIGHLYSSKNALGLLLSTGNVGYHLTTKTTDISTFVSRDAGKTWTEMSKGSSIYESGDHGSFIVFGSDQISSNQIYFSVDEGQTVDSIKLPVKFEIYDVIGEPSNTASHFIAVAITAEEQGVLVSIDFSNYFPRMCAGSQTLDSPDSDYEIWSPHAAHSLSNCLLGRKINVVRKKVGTQCFNGENFERKSSIQNCECTQEDWECDVGWFREGEGSCKKKEGSELDFKPPEKCVVYYTVSQGYRKVAGDSCENGIDLAPLKVPCQSSFSFSGLFSTGFFLVATLGIIALILYSISTGKLVEIFGSILSIPFIEGIFSKKSGIVKSEGQLGGMKAGSLFEDNEDDEED